MIDALPLLLGPEGYQISRSVRLRSSASAYFNRTFGTASLGATFSFWVKRGALPSASAMTLFGYSNGSNESFAIDFSSDKLDFYSYSSGYIARRLTTQVFRDSSAWYHIVCVVDSANATALDRMRVYINGVQITAFDATVNQAQNQNLNLTQGTWAWGIGRSGGTANQYFDGYLTEVNFIDGQALTPTSFGETNAVTGVWQPKKYAGTYGTNGFYLNFSDNSGATATTIGKDNSGNGNNWTPNNISVTAGATYDSMLDVPTQWADGGNGRGNYAVLNPVYVIPSNTANTFTNGNLTFAPTQAEGTGTASAVTSLPLPTIGKWYWEITPSVVSTLSSTRSQIGVMARAQISFVPAQNADCFVYVPSGQKATGNVYTAYGNTYAANDVIGVAVDLDNGAIYFAKNGTWQNSGDPTSGATKTGAAFTTLTGTSEYFPAVGFWGTFNANFGQRPFAYTPPTGFKALNTLNLP